VACKGVQYFPLFRPITALVEFLPLARSKTAGTEVEHGYGKANASGKAQHKESSGSALAVEFVLLSKSKQ